MKKTPNVVDGNHIAKLKEFLEITIKEQASDLHLSVGHQPVLRVAGVLVPLLKEPVLTSVDMQELTKALMNAEQYQNFLGEKEIDFSYNFEDIARFRVNVFMQQQRVVVGHGVGAHGRLVPLGARPEQQ